MKSLHKIQIKSQDENSLFEYSYLDFYQIQQGKYIRRMYKALRNMNYNHKDAIDKVIIDIKDNSIYGFNEYVNEDFIREILKV